jgi:hypothetical protein
MSVLSELQALDLSQVTSARGTITTTVARDDVSAVLGGGAGPGALGDLGALLEEARTLVDHPEALVEELAAGLAGLLEDLGLPDLPIDEWEAAIREGAEIFADLLAAFGGDLTALSGLIGTPLAQTATAASSALDGLTRRGIVQFDQLRRAAEAANAPVPTDPAAFAEAAFELLVPLPSAAVGALRDGAGGLQSGLGALALPAGRFDATLAALRAVADAAAEGDAAAVQARIADLRRVHAGVVDTVAGDLRALLGQVQSLRAPAIAEGLETAASALGGLDPGALDIRDRLEAELDEWIAAIAGLDVSALGDALSTWLAGVDAQAQELLVDPVDRQVEAVGAWLRGLLAHLPLVELRAQLSAAVHRAAAAIAEADLDAPAEAVRDRLRGLGDDIAAVDVGPAIHDAVEQVVSVLTSALTAIVTALGAIGTAIGQVAEGAADLVEQAVGVLRELSDAVEAAQRAVQELPIEAARDQIIDTLHDLAEQVQELFAEASLPDAVRPLIDQLASEVHNIDVEEALREPLASFDAVTDIDLSGKVRQLQGVLSNLVPAQLARELTDELEDFLHSVETFDPSSLRTVVEHYLDEAARTVAEADLSPLRELLHRPFALVLEGLDELAPSRLLAPLLAAFDDLVGDLLPADSGAAVAQAIEPIGSAVGQAGGALLDRATGSLPVVRGAAASQATKPGDFIRALGEIPGRIRAVLLAATGDARAALAGALHALCGGLAADLRSLGDIAWAAVDELEADIDAAMVPLAEAQARTALALRVHFDARIAAGEQGVEAQATASFAVVDGAGPVGTRESLAPGVDALLAAGRDAAGTVTATGTAIEHAAAALERSPLAAAGDDADRILAILDFEPLAAKLDALVDAVLDRAPAIAAELGDDLVAAINKLLGLVLDRNPAALLQRFLRVFDVLREQLELVNPHSIVEELDVIHAAVRESVSAYDPAGLVDDLQQLLGDVGTAIRNIGLDGFPTQAELQPLSAQVARARDAVPTQALEDVGEALADAGEQLEAIDLVGLADDVEAVRDRLEEALVSAAQAVQREIEALLGSLHYSSTSASASASASGGTG